ncbi:MAG TPA: ATP-binding protein [Geothermobacteraceae bacterium]|nr:ATP-binding protein [Geothermobacteraceae bacterium]
MRLTLKIALAILFGVGLLLSLHSYQSVQREKDLLKENLSHEARQVGQVLRIMVAEIWQSQGERAARAFLKRSDSANEQMQIRWVWMDLVAPKPLAPSISDEKLKATEKGESVTIMGETNTGEDFLFTYIPLRSKDGRVGAIEITESLKDLHGYIRESMRRSASLMAAIVASSLLVIIAIGSFWVSEPVRRLAEQADRIAAGDFSPSLKLRGSDDFATLTAAIDRMRSQLATARKADQDRLEALEKFRHTERLATIGRLSAGMAHELGTPLNVISGRAKLIGSGDLPDIDIKKSARIIGEQADRMTALMRQLLDFARRGTPQKQAVDLEQLINYVINLLQPTAAQHQVTLTNHAPQAVRALADSNQLQQVLLNLTMNGIQAMPSGGTLTLSVEQTEPLAHPEKPGEKSAHYALISVIDTGDGISEEHLPHLFDPFFTTKDIGQGSGLGLSIAYGIVQEHDGWIAVQSELGRGSQFRVYLPIAEQPQDINA